MESDSSDDDNNGIANIFKVVGTVDTLTFSRIDVSTPSFDGKIKITFTYSVGSRDYLSYFTFEDECIQVLSSRGVPLNSQNPFFYTIILSIGLTALPWIWMGFVTKTIIVKSTVHMNMLTIDMQKFWNILFNNTLIEFIHLHQHIGGVVDVLPFQLYFEDYNDSIIFGGNTYNMSESTESTVLLPIGGGKDSLVAWYLTAHQNIAHPSLLYVADGLYEYEGNWRLQAICDRILALNTTDISTSINIVRHVFVTEEFEKYAKSYYKPAGHPWAALVLFDSVLVSYLKGYSTVTFGYEKSANEGNHIYMKGVEINHQYDKSLIFLQLAQEYIHSISARYGSSDSTITVVSPLHEMWEIEISRLFCEVPELNGNFMSLFLSCNEPVDYTKWCCKCDKCVFIYLIMSAWLPPTTVAGVFDGRCLYEQEVLLPLFYSLVDASTSKPFDCVGTESEAKAAIHLSVLRYQENNSCLPFCLQKLVAHLGINTEETVTNDQILEKWLPRVSSE
jgi:hypothetical protein